MQHFLDGGFTAAREFILREFGNAFGALDDLPMLENPKGELGYYFVSDGSAKPVRWRIRPPSFINLAALPKLCEGVLLSDVIAINASVDIVMGEVDR